MNEHVHPMSTRLSRFDNWSNDQLADAIGDADAHAKAKQAYLDALKDEAKRRNVEIAQGAKWCVRVDPTTSRRLDTKRLATDLGDALDEYYVTTMSQRLTISRLFREGSPDD